MMRKTPLFGLNLFYHDDPIIAVEDVRPGAAYTGPLQVDPQNTLNFNFKRMDFVLQSILDGTLSFTSFRTAGGNSALQPGDIGVGGDLYVEGSLHLSAEKPLVMVRDHRPSPHLVFDLADALVYAGWDTLRSVALTRGGVSEVGEVRLHPFTPDLRGVSFAGSEVYPIEYTVSGSAPLLDTSLAATARLLLAFDGIPQGLTRIQVEVSYDGSLYTVVGSFTQGLDGRSVLLPELTFSGPPRGLRIRLEGTNSPTTSFSITRLALMHSGTPALEGAYLPRGGGRLFGNLEFNQGTRLEEAGAGLLATQSLRLGGNLEVLGSLAQPLTVAPGVTVDGVDLSAFKALFDTHRHDGVQAPRVQSREVLAQPFDSLNFPSNQNSFSYDVQAYLDALQSQLNSLVQGAATFDNLVVRNLNFTVGGSFNAGGVTLNAGAAVLSGNAQALQLVSSAPAGTAPLVVASSTHIPNLNADLLDGFESAVFPRVDANSVISGAWTFSGDLTVRNLLVANGAHSMQAHTLVDGRFLMAPWDEGARQWGREFGYAPDTDSWYLETTLDISSTSRTAQQGWPVGLSLRNGNTSMVEHAQSGIGLAFSTDGRLLVQDGRVGNPRYSTIFDVYNVRLGIGVNVTPSHTLTVHSSDAQLADFARTNSSVNAGPGVLFRNVHGNHSWGVVAEFRVDGAGDTPSIMFSSGHQGATWAVGYSNQTPHFSINQNKGHRLSTHGIDRLWIYTNGIMGLRSDWGWGEMGPRNGEWFHFETDRPRYFFNRPVEMMDEVRVHQSNTFLTPTSGQIGGFAIWTNGNNQYAKYWAQANYNGAERVEEGEVRLGNGVRLYSRRFGAQHVGEGVYDFDCWVHAPTGIRSIGAIMVGTHSLGNNWADVMFQFVDHWVLNQGGGTFIIRVRLHRQHLSGNNDAVAPIVSFTYEVW
jgi:hypothetical protein